MSRGLRSSPMATRYSSSEIRLSRLTSASAKARFEKPSRIRPPLTPATATAWSPYLDLLVAAFEAVPPQHSNQFVEVEPAASVSVRLEEESDVLLVPFARRFPSRTSMSFGRLLGHGATFGRPSLRFDIGFLKESGRRDGRLDTFLGNNFRNRLGHIRSLASVDVSGCGSVSRGAMFEPSSDRSILARDRRWRRLDDVDDSFPDRRYLLHHFDRLPVSCRIGRWVRLTPGSRSLKAVDEFDRRNASRFQLRIEIGRGPGPSRRLVPETSAAARDLLTRRKMDK